MEASLVCHFMEVWVLPPWHHSCFFFLHGQSSKLLLKIALFRYFNRLIGVVAFNEEHQLVRFGYLGFWGGRKNLIVNLNDVIPLTDSLSVDQAKALVKLDFKQWVFFNKIILIFICFRHGFLLLTLSGAEIVDEELAKEIFGSLKYFRKFESD